MTNSNKDRPRRRTLTASDRREAAVRLQAKQRSRKARDAVAMLAAGRARSWARRAAEHVERRHKDAESNATASDADAGTAAAPSAARTLTRQKMPLDGDEYD